MGRLSVEIVEGFVGALLRPVVRFCVKKGCSYSAFCKLAKQLFFEAGQEYIRSHDQDASVSRISALTGLDRRDISRFQKDGSFFTRKVNLLSRVIGQWEQDSRFSKGAGRPKLLTCEGTSSEFFALVQSVSKDLNPYTVLSELERVGAVVRDKDKLRLSTEVYVPRGDVQDGLRILGLDVQDLLSAVEKNLIESDKTPHLHIRTQYDNLSPEALEKIQNWFLEKGGELHREARQFLSNHDKDLNPKITKGGARAVIGSFAFVEKPDEKGS